MESYSIIVFIFGIICLFLFVMIYFINRILQHRVIIDNRFMAVRDAIDKRIELLEDMILFLKNNLGHEKSYQKKLVQTKELLMGVKNNKDGILTIKKTEKDIFSFTKLENIYNNLGKNKEYLKLKDEILKNKEKLVYAFDSYDKGVIKYNNYRQKKYIKLLSKLCRLDEYDCYNK